MYVWVMLWAAVYAVGVDMGEGMGVVYKDTRLPVYTSENSPQIIVRGQCRYPCQCGGVPDCRPGVTLVRDGCGCCLVCAGQVGDQCHTAAPCDRANNLTCLYTTSTHLTGICQETITVGCKVNNKTYNDGQIFTLDCRTQCTCQNGTYACVSLCPNEALLPSAQCHNPHLVTVPGRCCREWMCDAAPDKSGGPPECDRTSGRWSQCSVQTCGGGVSVRWSTDTSHCNPVNETRLCQLRPCRDKALSIATLPWNTRTHHHIRRSHHCKATLRSERSVRLRVGWCVSERRYKPKMCATCTSRCCSVHSSTTISIPFLCPLHANTNLLAVPHTRYETPNSYPKPRQITTPSVYDMMDEGQPVSEAVLSYPRQENDLYDDDWETEEHIDHENLWMEDDTLYEDIKRDNYETIHYKVEWILRCKCDSTCDPVTSRNKPLTPAHHTPPT